MITTCLSFVLAAIGAEPTPQPELMPPTPADWRFERLNFPLSFAPELKYKGFEELRFAPGMFTPESDTYFTYIFAMKITDDVTLDAAALQSLLETYYRGLCQTVAKEKKFDIDASKISARVRADQPDAQPARHFSATVASFDPFVTGKPLTLNLEMIVIDVSRTDHRIFAAVSPKPLDSPVWKLLRTLKDQFQERCAEESK
jgi:hypothetical protein